MASCVMPVNLGSDLILPGGTSRRPYHSNGIAANEASGFYIHMDHRTLCNYCPIADGHPGKHHTARPNHDIGANVDFAKPIFMG